MDLDRGFISSSLTSTVGVAAEDAEAVATDRMEMEAAETLAALAHLKKRDAVAVAAEFAAKWGCKDKRVRKRVSSSESPPSDIRLNPVDPVQSGSDLAEDRATVGQQQIQVTSTTLVIESVEAEQNAESLNTSHPCAARYTSNGVVRSRQNSEKETHTLHRMLTNKESDWQMIRERQILFSIVGMPEKDIWEDSQQDQITGNNALIKPVKTERNAELVKSSPTCATKYMSGGGGRSRQNLTEAEKEVRRLRRILANRESARQTIRRRQALYEKLTLKAADLTLENENLKRAKELALKEYQSQESTNKHLKAEMAKAIKAEEGKAPGESSHPVESQCGHQGIFVPSSISTPTNGRLDSSHDQENPINVDGPKTPLNVVPYPWFFSLPYHRNGLHPPRSCGPKDIEDESSVNNQFSAGFQIKEEVDHGVNTEAAPIRACHCVGALPEENQESANYMSKKALDAVAAVEARKRRKELTKLKNLHGRQCRLHR